MATWAVSGVTTAVLSKQKDLLQYAAKLSCMLDLATLDMNHDSRNSVGLCQVVHPNAPG